MSEITFNRFVEEFLLKNNIDKVEIVNNRYARIKPKIGEVRSSDSYSTLAYLPACRVIW